MKVISSVGNGLMCPDEIDSETGTFNDGGDGQCTGCGADKAQHIEGLIYDATQAAKEGWYEVNQPPPNAEPVLCWENDGGPVVANYYFLTGEWVALEGTRRLTPALWCPIVPPPFGGADRSLENKQ